MITMHQDALLKAAAGITSLEEILRVSSGDLSRMNAFRYQAIEANRRAGRRRHRGGGPQGRASIAWPARAVSRPTRTVRRHGGADSVASTPANESRAAEVRFGQRVKRKDITAFTREMSALLGAAHSHSAGAGQLGRGGGKPGA